MGNDSVGLSEAIRRLRAELSQARDEGEDAELRFRLGPVQMEFQVQVTREGAGEAGIKFWVVSVGASGGISGSDVHKVALTLVPQIERDGQLQDAVIGDRVSARPVQPSGARG